MKIFSAAVLASAILASACTAQAANLVTNGSFTDTTLTSNSQFGADFGGQAVTGWTGLGGNHLQFYYFGGTQTTTNAVNQFGDPLGYFYDSFNALSPDGGAFVGLDGDSDYSGQISQTISGLTVGQAYDLSFDWAAGQLRNRTGDTTELLRVTFGGQTFDTETLSVPSTQFSGWRKANFSFTATATSQVLSFLSVGTPNGLPPIAAIDGVSLTTAVPEPAVWAMMLAGFGGMGALLRRRRALAV